MLRRTARRLAGREERNMSEEKIITVFGSSRPKEKDADYAEARELGRALAKQGFAVCSGGYGGVMEAGLEGRERVWRKDVWSDRGIFQA